MILFIPYTGFGKTTIAHFNEALYQWNKYAGKTLMRRDPTVRHSSTNYPTDDGKNYIYRVNIGSEDYVAQTSVYWNPTKTSPKSVDINLNMYYAWANSAMLDHFDVWSVFLHETGHVAGLNHSSKSDAVMYAFTKENSTKRYLTTDDINGITAIYGETSTNVVSPDTLHDYGTDKDNITTAVLSGVLRQYEYADLIRNASLIVRATVQSQSEPFQILPTFGDSSSNFTDYNFKVNNVLFGSAELSDEITVRVQGGCVNNYNLIVENAPKFAVGNDVLLFLYHPDMGAVIILRENTTMYSG